MNMHSFGVEYILVVMALIILYLVYYVLSRDSICNKNIQAVASVVEDLNRELYFIKSRIENIQQSSQTDDKIYQEIEKTVYDMVRPLSVGLKNMQENIQSLEMEISSKISSVENTNGLMQMSVPLHVQDDEKIISLFEQGFSVEHISKELHASQAEVEFVLKIRKMK